MELIAPVRVVVIDDKPTHLFSIANGLTLAGIPCAWHWYDAKNNRLTPPPPQGGYKFLRMLFTDLNIRSGPKPDAATLAGTLMTDVLQPIISPEAGPYSLVLWTNVDGTAENVGPIINERINADGLGGDRRPQPLAISILPKRDFVPAYEEGAENALSTLLADMATRSAQLTQLVTAAASKDTQLRVACAWESRASIAAAETVGSVYRAAVVDAAHHRTTPSASFQKLLGRIAVEASGVRNAKEEPMRALDDGLIDLFVDDMRSTSGDSEYVGAVNDALAGVLQAQPQALSPDARSILNTILQVEYLPKATTRIPRGAVITIDDKNIEQWCGNSKKDLIWNEFFIPMNQLSDQLARMKSEQYPEDVISRMETRLSQLQKNKDKLEQEAKVIALEIGADCDHAQRKPRTVRLLWGIEIPSYLSDFIDPWGNSGQLKHDALALFGPWCLNGREVRLIISVKRFGIQQKWEREKHMEIQYRLRKPLVDYVLHKYSTHSTRPGVMEITG